MMDITYKIDMIDNYYYYLIITRNLTICITTSDIHKIRCHQKLCLFFLEKDLNRSFLASNQYDYPNYFINFAHHIKIFMFFSQIFFSIKFTNYMKIKKNASNTVKSTTCIKKKYYYSDIFQAIVISTFLNERARVLLLKS